VKHLKASRTIWDDIDFISFQGEKLPQNPLHRTIALNDRNPVQCGRSQFGVSEVAAKVVAAISFPPTIFLDAPRRDETTLSVVVRRMR
jgi:hypothetical protein